MYQQSNLNNPVISLTDMVRMTLFRKYQLALEALDKMQTYQLRSRTGTANHPGYEALFKSATCNLLYELNPHLPEESTLKKAFKRIVQSTKYDTSEYKECVIQAGVQLSKMGILR